MGEYRKFVAAQSRRNPSIQNLLTFLASEDPERSRCRLAYVDFYSDNSDPLIREVDAKNLESLLEPSWKRDYRSIFGRILIIEDLTKDVVEILGSALHVDPLFFASHLHIPFPDISIQTPDMAMLPSRLKLDKFISIHYHRTIVFNDTEIGTRKLLRASNMERKVMVLPKTKGVRIGLAQHSCSIFKTLLTDKTWIAVVLVDPPITDVYHSVKKGKRELLRFDVPSSLFLGGYEDFLDPPAVGDSHRYHTGPTRSGLFEDLLYYWERQRPACFDIKSPSLLHVAYYPIRIVAAEWINYLTVMHHSIKHYEYTVEDLPALFQELDRLNSDLRALQSWRRRSMSSQQKMRAVARFIRHSNGAKNHLDDLEVLAQDYDELAANVDDFGQRFERMLPVVTSMVQIADSRRSFAETANVSRLTYLALVFVPLTFTTGLFSMNDDIAPGSSGFWIFFAVALPVTLLVYWVARPPMREMRMIKDYFMAMRRLSLPHYFSESSGIASHGSLAGTSEPPSPFAIEGTYTELDPTYRRAHTELSDFA